MSISASMVKELRERTGAGMMECKKALTEANGDMDVAIEALRLSGLAKADKKAGNTAAEGVIAIELSDDRKQFGMVEVNSQTDFAAKSEDFQGFVGAVVKAVLATQPAESNDEAIAAMDLGGKALEEVRKELSGKIGENIQARRVAAAKTDGHFGSYLHGDRIGVVVELEGGDETLAKDIAMHVAALNPQAIDEAALDPAVVEKERNFLETEVADSGKPADIVAKMIDGRMKKFLAEVTLVGQAFVKDPDNTVGQLLEKAGAKVKAIHRLQVGEGIEKQEDNFADEVSRMAAEAAKA